MGNGHSGHIAGKLDEFHFLPALHFSATALFPSCPSEVKLYTPIHFPLCPNTKVFSPMGKERDVTGKTEKINTGEIIRKNENLLSFPCINVQYSDNGTIVPYSYCTIEKEKYFPKYRAFSKNGINGNGKMGKKFP